LLRGAGVGAKQDRAVPFRHEPQRIDVGPINVCAEFPEKLLAHELIGPRNPNPRRSAGYFLALFHLPDPSLRSISRPPAPPAQSGLKTPSRSSQLVSGPLPSQRCHWDIKRRQLRRTSETMRCSEGSVNSQQALRN